MSEKNEQSRRRKWAPKARTGCRTCKTRHVKCDEQRPVCRRCILSGFRCDGYALNDCRRDDSTSPISEQSPEGTKALTPESTLSTLTVSPADTPVSSIDSTSTATTNSLTLVFNAAGPCIDDERHSLQVFTDLTAVIVGRSPAAPHFWQTLVPQAAWQYSGLRHAMLAAALSSESLLRRDPPEVRQKVDLQVLMHSSKAVNSLLTDNAPLDVVLLTSATLGILDLFNGDWDTAITHVTSGAKLATQARQDPSCNPYVSFYCEAFAAALPNVLTNAPDATPLPASKITRVRLQETIKSLELAADSFDHALMVLEHSNAPDREAIMRVIQNSQYECRWIQSRWGTLLQEELIKTSPPVDAENAHLHVVESPWRTIMSELDIYLTQGGIFELSKFEIVMERTLPFYLFAKAGPHLEMRQETTELMYLGAKMRGKKVPEWHHYVSNSNAVHDPS